MLRYKGAGLKNIYLTNGFHKKKTPYGMATSVDDVEELHQAIGEFLVNDKPTLTGAEFRFLRKELNLAQKKLGALMGLGEQAVAKWEKTGRVPAYADRFIRLIYKESVEGEIHVQSLMNHLNEVDQLKDQKLVFEHTQSGWMTWSGKAVPA